MGDIKWTDQQKSAIYTGNCNLLVAAAAGSGKTAVLVERIIEKIIDEDNPVDIDRLLIVTFTKAAASEMKERIGDGISKKLDEDPNSIRLQRQLTLLNKANITTIHSFCLQVIRSNFHMLDIDPSFRVADSTEIVLLKKEALDELFEEMYDEENCTEEFLKLIDSYGEKDDIKVLNMVEELYDFSQSLPDPYNWINEMTECFNVDSKFDFKTSIWAKVIMEDLKIEINGLRLKILSALKIIRENEGLENYESVFKEDLINIENILKSSSFKEISKAFINVDFNSLPRKRIEEFLKDKKDKIVDIRKKVKDKINKIKENVFKGEENIGKVLLELYPRMRCLGKLVIDFEKKYSEKKREKNIIDFNDIEHFALNILIDFDLNNKKIPSTVAIELRKKFEEVLVDEYQDSNLVQEDILNSVSRQPNIKLKDKRLTNPNMFMVGDVKQSIYRFRQAKPELFLQKYNSYSQKKGERNLKIKLFKNFRSRKEIIEGVNFIFTQIMSKNIGELNYDDEEKLNVGVEFKNTKENLNYGGPIEINLLEKNTSQDTGYENNENDEVEELDNIQLEANMVVSIINTLIKGDKNNSPFMVLDKITNEYRKVQFRDIVILMRATSTMAPVFIEELNNKGIPIFADTNSGYFETSEIKTILALLQVVDNPLQDIPMLSVLRSPVFSLEAEEIIDIRLLNNELSIYENMQKIHLKDECEEEKIKYIEKLSPNIIKKISEILSEINKWRRESLHMSIDQFIWNLYTDTGYYGYVGAMPGGLQRQANLRVLFERAKQFENTSYKGLFNFVTFIDRLKSSSGDMGSAKTVGENEDVVRIMSIHKSKGLEFPIVIMAGMGKGFNFQDMRKSILFHHELGFGPEYVDLDKRISYPTILKEAIKSKIKLETLSEEMRILYVAFTRAKEKLIMTGMVSKLDKSIEKWCDIGLEQGEKISDYDLIEGKNYLDWIMPCITRHKDGMIFRKKAGICDLKQLVEHSSKWKIKIWDKEELIKSKIKEKENLDIVNQLKFLQDTKDNGYENEIDYRLNWIYKYIECCSIPVKFSVSEIKRKFSELDEENSKNIMASSLLKKPLFLEKTKKFSKSEIGTFMHLAMQHIDIKKVSTIDEIKLQLENMVLKEFITEEQRKIINSKKIFNFFKSDLGKRMINSDCIKREIPFYIEVNPTELYKDLPKDIYGEEKILIQGIIDMCFQEKDALVLVDYKTDYVDDLEDIKNKYRVQLKYYCEALERITHKKVIKKYIYLFYCDKEVEI